MKLYSSITFGLSVIICLFTVSGILAGPIVSVNDIHPATEFCTPKETAGPEGPVTIDPGETYYFFGDSCTLWITAVINPVTVTATIYDQQPPCKPFPFTEYMTRYIDLEGSTDGIFDLYIGYSQTEFDLSDFEWPELDLVMISYDGDTTNCEGEWIKVLPTFVTDTPQGGSAMVTTDHLGLWSFEWHSNLPPWWWFTWLLSFTATAGDRFTLVQWITACETNNLGFFIERSTNGTNWSRINTQIIEGAGTSPMRSEYTYTDQHLNNGVHYTYRLIFVRNNGDEYLHYMTTGVTPSFLGDAIVITDYKLHQNYPNPFNPSTTIVYDILEQCQVRMVVYNILGEEVTTLVNEDRDRGRYAASFNTSGLSSGIYFYVIQAGGFKDIRKMVLIQ